MGIEISFQFLCLINTQCTVLQSHNLQSCHARYRSQIDHPKQVLTLVLQAEMHSLKDLTKLFFPHFFPHFTSKRGGGGGKVCKISRITLVLALISVL